MLATQYKQSRKSCSFGVMIIIDSQGFRVETDGRDDVVLLAEIYCNGKLLKQSPFASRAGYRDNIFGVDPSECGMRVLDAEGKVVAVLDVEIDPFPFMTREGEQQHITENYVAVPPALTITDEAGAIWTLGMTVAPKHKSPDGEFAFPVMRNGLDMGEIASRIERRNGKIKIFTCEGWKVWTGRSFF